MAEATPLPRVPADPAALADTIERLVLCLDGAEIHRVYRPADVPPGSKPPDPGEYMREYCRGILEQVYLAKAIALALPNVPAAHKAKFLLDKAIAFLGSAPGQDSLPTAEAVNEGLAKAYKKCGGELMEAAAELKASANPAPILLATGWDAPTEARNKWLYEEAVKGTPWGTIKTKLGKKPKSWERIDTIEGIRQAAHAYAKRLGLPEVPSRHPGRPRRPTKIQPRLVEKT